MSSLIATPAYAGGAQPFVTDHLWSRGETPLMVAVPDYHKSRVKPRSFEDFCAMFAAEDHGPLGLWEIARVNPHTGELLSRLWAKNVITDNGALAMLKNTWNNAGSAVGIFNQIAIDTNCGSTTLTTALTNGQTGITSLAVASLPAQIPSGASLLIGYGTGQTQTVTTSAVANAGATSISVNSFTANAAYAIGTNVVPQPTTSDNPSSLGGTVAYSGALGSGAFAFSGSGAGNRQLVITYTFPIAPTTTAGNYTEAWTVNTNPVAAAGETASHLTFAPQAVTTAASALVTITEKC